MILKFLASQQLLILFLTDICVGQIVFEPISNTPAPESSCTTPDRKRGNCKRWTECEELNRKIKTWDEMQPYLCGFAVTEPRICCPMSPQTNVFDRPAVIISPTNTRFAAANTPSEVRIKPSRSQNTSNGKPNFLPDNCGSPSNTQIRVIGGQVSEKGSWPWMVVLFRRKRNGSKREAFCGGALVTARHVITAAHCVVRQNTNIPLNPKRFMVRVGVHNLTNEEDPDAMDVAIDSIRIHENYDLRTRTDDIAVLRLSQPVPFSNNTSPVCLPYDSLRNENLTGRHSTVTGFGLTTVNDTDSYSDVLIEVSFDIENQETCKKTYERDLRITNVHLCAGTLDGSRDSCQGDSGGPLMAVGKNKRYYLVGVVSFGKNCAQVGYPGVYTRVTEYLDWLAQKLAD